MRVKYIEFFQGRVLFSVAIRILYEIHKIESHRLDESGYLTDQMQNFEAVYEVVDLSHEAFHENDFRETNAHHPELRRKSIQVIEIMKLHGRTEVQQHVSEVWTFVTQFMEHCMSDELDRQLDVFQGRRCRNKGS